MMATPGTTPRIYLKPGKFHFAVTPTIVSTVLGSCISVTMHNPEYTMGAICHAVLPDELIPGEPYRYVDSSIAAMVRLFDRYRINRRDIQVKLFGGADILPQGENGYRHMTVGQQSILRANQIIEREQLRIIASDVGGTRGRKLFFHTHSGEIYLQRLRDSAR